MQHVLVEEKMTGFEVEGDVREVGFVVGNVLMMHDCSVGTAGILVFVVV
jgi:hypothetical protein